MSARSDTAGGLGIGREVVRAILGAGSKGIHFWKMFRAVDVLSPATNLGCGSHTESTGLKHLPRGHGTPASAAPGDRGIARC